MLNSMAIEGFKWGTTGDLKIAICVVCKSGGQSTYGCPYCDMPETYLDSEYNLLSLANLGELHEALVAARSNRKDQTQFQNCVNPNL